MSNWTHVAGIIRVDGFYGFFDQEESEKEKLEEVIGRECLWESPEEVWDEMMTNVERFLPMGSEGSLHSSIWINPDEGTTARYTISVFGDLRDHESAKEIIDWFRGKCREFGYSVRNAVITATNEINGTETYTFNMIDEEDYFKKR